MKRLFTFILTVLYYNVIGQINYNFENEDLSNWIQKPINRWQIVSTNPLSGLKSLKHNFDNSVASADTIYTSLPNWDISKGDVVWRMLVKHNYDPSSSNNWYVYIMSDSIAMANPGKGSGYAVGVNLTGSDDLLKVWRIDEGTPQAIITSTLNWQTLIGTSKIGAIEVERLSDGTFTLKASVNGSFTDLVKYGTSVDVELNNFKYLGIVYKYSASADRNLTVDDISLSYQPNNQNNTNTNIVAPNKQILGGAISSLVATKESAIPVFKFSIADMGTGDNLSTYVKKVCFKNPNPANSPWSKLISGALLYQQNNEITNLYVQINDDEIILLTDSTEMTIDDGSTDEYTLFIYLKQGNITERSSLSFEIDSENHGFVSSINGSGFLKSLTDKITSNEFVIEVVASKLLFTEQPLSVGINKSFSVNVSGCDTYGNIDSDFEQSVAISLNDGEGTLASPSGLTTSAVKGVAAWLDLNYNKLEVFSIKAASNNLNDGFSDFIAVTNDTTTVVQEPYYQPETANISSLQTSPDKAFEVIRFKITDMATGDYVPTILKSIRLYRTNIADIATLNKTIAGVLVKRNGILCGLSDVQIKTNYIDIYFPELAITIADGTYTELSVWLYLKESELIDGQKIQLKVDKTNHGFTGYSSGSGFSSQFSSSINSNIFTINVVATKLNFTETPERVGVNENFSVKVAATDILGNIDKNFSGDVDLQLALGNGALMVNGGNTSPLTNGEASIDSARYSLPEKFKLMAINNSLDDAASNFITCGDNDGIATPLIYSMDSTFFNATVNSPEKTIDVIRFRLKDCGTTEGLPLIPTKFILSNFSPNNNGLLSKMVKGVIVKTNTSTVTPEKFSFTSNGLEILIKEGDLLIENDDSLDISVGIYLHETGLIDCTTFQFYVPTSNAGWEASVHGTAFSNSFPSTIYGKPCKVDIVANSLEFSEIPSIISPRQNFSLEIAAIDPKGNVDKNFQGYAVIGLYSGKGELHTTSSISPINSGIAKWTDLSIDSIGKYRFKVFSGALPESISDEIISGYSKSCIVDEDFEAGSPDWEGIENWKITGISPINGNNSLVHAGNPEDMVSTFAIPIVQSYINGNPTEWNITIKNSNWDPSSDNYFYFVPISTSKDLLNPTTKGIAIGVNPSSSDTLALWYFEGDETNELIRADFDWNNNDELHIKFTISPTGIISLWYSPKNLGKMILAGKTDLPKNLQNGYCGFVYGYTPSRAGQIWIDNLEICYADFPPVHKLVKTINLTTVKAEFSKNIVPESAKNIQNYCIKTNNGDNIKINSIYYDEEKNSQAVLYTDKMPQGELFLITKNIQDVNGYSIIDTSEFGIGTEGNIGRLVINEIMANPIPSAGLPEYEYVEVYNPTSDSISLNGWKFQFNNTFIKLPFDIIPPSSYAVLCSNSAKDSLSKFGKAIGVTGFPSILNDGMLIKLYDDKSNLVSFANFDKTWYRDIAKSNGGYSIEKIDAQNLAESLNNWQASQSLIGGTPCSLNSVVKTNPDVTKPKILSVKVISDTNFEIQYSEPMDSLSIMLPYNYSIDNGIGLPLKIELTGQLFDKVKITTQIPLEVKKVYEMIIFDGIFDFSGNRIDETKILIGLPQKPEAGDIVINEILFNPYVGGDDFVEVFNKSSKIFDLSTLMLGNRNLDNNMLKEIYYASDTAHLLFPNEYAIITTNQAMVSHFYFVQNPTSIACPAKIASFNNDEGYVVLMDDSLNIIDEFYYTEKMHSKLIADTKGVSLERISPNLPTNEASTWQSASQVVGFATPTYKNSQYTDATTSSSNFTLSPETFSPDGDGRDDYLLINYNLPDAGCVANIRVYTSSGVEIYRLANNLLLGTEGSIRWDGINFSNRRVPVGIYIIYIEYFNLNGDVKKEKKVCVVASRG